MSGCKIIRVKNILGELLHKPGGVSRDEAVQEAQQLIEELREECEKAVPVEIARLEEMVAKAVPQISRFQLLDVLSQVDPLLTLSGTFGAETLDAVVKMFCDFVAGMVEKNLTDTAPLLVHLRAMRLLLNSEISADDSAEILQELALVHAHYGVTSHLDDAPPPDTVPG